MPIMLIRLRPTHTSRRTYAIYPVVSHNGLCHINGIGKQETAMTKLYEVQKMTFDAAHPYAVVATFRGFNRVIARYEDEAAAKRRARDLNKREG